MGEVEKEERGEMKKCGKRRRGEEGKEKKEEVEKERRGEREIYPKSIGIFFHLQWVTVYTKANKWCQQNLY